MMPNLVKVKDMTSNNIEVKSVSRSSCSSGSTGHITCTFIYFLITLRVHLSIFSQKFLHKQTILDKPSEFVTLYITFLELIQKPLTQRYSKEFFMG